MGIRKILVITVHPALNMSRVTKRVWEQLVLLPGIDCYDLYALYPDFYIDVVAEQEKLRTANLVVFLHPIYWYGAPSLLKEWQMRVLTLDFAYGKHYALEDKDLWQVVSAGGSEEKYSSAGALGYSMTELMRPYEAMAKKCKMQWHPPKALYHSQGAANEDEIDEHARTVLRILLDYQSQGRKTFEYLAATIK